MDYKRLQALIATGRAGSGSKNASRRPSEAFTYNNGPLLCRVLLWGERVEHRDKMCAEYRHVVAMHDVHDLLHGGASAPDIRGRALDAAVYERFGIAREA